MIIADRLEVDQGLGLVVDLILGQDQEVGLIVDQDQGQDLSLVQDQGLSRSQEVDLGQDKNQEADQDLVKDHIQEDQDLNLNHTQRVDQDPVLVGLIQGLLINLIHLNENVIQDLGQENGLDLLLQYQ